MKRRHSHICELLFFTPSDSSLAKHTHLPSHHQLPHFNNTLNAFLVLYNTLNIFIVVYNTLHAFIMCYNTLNVFIVLFNALNVFIMLYNTAVAKLMPVSRCGKAGAPAEREAVYSPALPQSDESGAGV